MVLTGTNVSLQANGVTAASIANRTRTVTVSGSQFNGITTTSAFNWNSVTNRGISVRSFGSANSNGVMSVSFQVPADYVGPSSSDLAACPSLTVPRLRLKWCTDDTAVTSHKMNVDVSFSQDDQLNSGANRFRYSVRQNANSGTDFATAGESLDPAGNTQIVTQVLPDAGDQYSTGEGAVVSWVAGQTIIVTLGRNATNTDDPNAQRIGIVSLSFEYESDE